MLSSLSGARILLTGNTGFKGSWYTKLLQSLGVEVIGLSLPGNSSRLFKELSLDTQLVTHFVDIRELAEIQKCFKLVNPDIIVHFAAQPLVVDSYLDPLHTFQTNVMGTANVLQAASVLDNNRASLVITTDKVYRNDEKGNPFAENSPLGGHDPYSASKACAELITNVWRNPVLNPRNSVIVSARSGNVIGGGDYSENRLLPDLMRAFRDGKIAKIRNSNSIRPWQHVLDPLLGYTLLLERMLSRDNLYTEYNFGPSPKLTFTVGDVTKIVSELWGDSASWEESLSTQNLPESAILKIDSTRAFNELNWENKLSIEEALRWLVSWEKSPNKVLETESQIQDYLGFYVSNSTG